MEDGVRTSSARAVLAGNVYSLNSEGKSGNDSGTYEIEEHSIPRGNCAAMSKRKGESLMRRLVYQSSHTTKELEQREGTSQAASQVICRSRSQTRAELLI